MMKYLNYIYLKNVMGLSPESGEIRFDFQKGINVIFGPNGTGKTRVLKAIRTFFLDKIKTAWLRSDDAGESDLELYISDGSKIDIEVSEKGTARRDFFDAIGKRIEKANMLDFISLLAVDPAKFFDPKGWNDRVKITLSALDILVTKENWLEKVGEGNLPLINFDANAPEQFEKAKEYFEEKRRDAGRVKREYEMTIENLKRKLPKKIEIDFDEKISQLDLEIQNANDNQRADEDKSLNALRVSLYDIDNQMATIKDEIATLETKLETLNGERKELVQTGSTIKAEIENKYLKVRQDLNSQKETWKNEAEKHEESKTTQKLIDQNQVTADEYHEHYEKYDGFLKAIDAWKKEIADKNPVLGLEVGAKDLVVDGKPWEVTNTARAVSIFIEIAQMHIQKLPEEMRIPLILCDDFEHIDESTRDELIPQIIENEFQAVFCEVDPRKNESLQLLYSFPKKEIVINGQHQKTT